MLDKSATTAFPQSAMIIGHDIKTKQSISVSLDKSRVVIITGKRGSGKSYTLGVLAEELFQKKHAADQRPLILLVDPLGIFFTFCRSNPFLPDADGQSTALPVRLLVPGDPHRRLGTDVVERMEELGVCFQSLRLSPNGLSPSAWCEWFDLSINEPLGIALFRAVQGLGPDFFPLSQLIERVLKDPRSQDKTKEALVNRLEMAKGWDIFSDEPLEISSLLDPESLNVLDLSVLSPGAYGLGNLIVSLLCQALFVRQVAAKRRENLGLASAARRIWLLIDEAQRFVPAGRSTLSKETLIAWTKEGRQPGLSVAIATQQPSAVDNEMLSQGDLVVSHHLSNQEDIAALNRLSPSYLGGEMKGYLRAINTPGTALLLDDFTEQLFLLTVRPRLTLHGGGESRLPL